MKNTINPVLVEVYKAQLMDARMAVTSARTLKQLKFLQDKITFLSQQISNFEGGKRKKA